MEMKTNDQLRLLVRCPQCKKEPVSRWDRLLIAVGVIDRCSRCTTALMKDVKSKHVN